MEIYKSDKGEVHFRHEGYGVDYPYERRYVVSVVNFILRFYDKTKAEDLFTYDRAAESWEF